MAIAKKPTRSTDPNVRKSPPFSASQFLVGHISVGNDGNNWIIVESANGVKRWAPYKKSTSTAKATSSTPKSGSIKLNPLVKVGEVFEDPNGKLYTITNIDEKNNYVEFKDELVGIRGAYFDSVNETINDRNWTLKTNGIQSQSSTTKSSSTKSVTTKPATNPLETQQEALDRYNTYISNSSNIYYTLPRTNIVVYIEDFLNIPRYQALIGNTVAIDENDIVFKKELQDYLAQSTVITNVKILPGGRADITDFTFEFDPDADSFETRDALNDLDNWLYDKMNVRNGIQKNAIIPVTQAPATSSNVRLKRLEDLLASSGTLYATLPKSGVKIYEFDDLNKNYQFYIQLDEYQDKYLIEKFLREKIKDFESVKEVTIAILRTGNLLHVIIEFDDTISRSTRLIEISILDNYLSGDLGIKPVSISTTSSSVSRQLQEFVDGLSSNGSLYYTLPKTEINVYQNTKFTIVYEFAIELQQGQDVDSVKRSLIDYMTHQQSIVSDVVIVNPTGKILIVTFRFGTGYSTAVKKEDLERIDNYLFTNIGIKPSITPSTTASSNIPSKFKVEQFYVTQDADTLEWTLNYISDITKLIGKNDNLIQLTECNSGVSAGLIDEKTFADSLNNKTYLHYYIPQMWDIIAIKYKGNPDLTIEIVNIDLSNDEIEVKSSDPRSTNNSYYSQDQFTELLIKRGISVLNFNPNARESRVQESTVQEAEAKIDDIVFSAPVVPVGTEDQRNATDKLVDEFIAKNQNNLKKLAVENVGLLSTIDKTLEFIKAKFGTPAPVTSISNVASAPSQTQPVGGIDDYKLIQFIGEDGERKVIEFKKFKTGKNANVFKYLIGDVFLDTKSGNGNADFVYKLITGAQEGGVRSGNIHYVDSFPGKVGMGLNWNNNIKNITVGDFEGKIETGEWTSVPGANSNLKQLNELASQTAKRSLQIGDIVKIKKSSKYYGVSGSNPKNTEGEIVNISSTGASYPITVRWANAKSNAYTENDLELVNPVQSSTQSSTPSSSPVTKISKRSYEVGNKVMISANSKFYGAGDSNPANVEGIIIDYDKRAFYPYKVQFSNGKINNYKARDLVLITTKLSTSTTATPAPAVTTTSSGSTTANVGDTVTFYASREKTNLTGIVKSIITGTDGKPYLRINVNGKFYLKQQGSVTKV
jgi:hypothetical protein